MLTSNGQETTDEACDELPLLTFDKEMVGSPTPNGDGTWTITYDLHVGNDGAAPTDYDLADALQYGAGITVTSASVTNTAPGGLPVSGGWNGADQQTIAADQPIGAGGAHTYRVTVVAEVAGDVLTDATDCTLGGGEGGTGFANTATLSSNGSELTDDDCAPAAAVQIAKEMVGEPVAQSDGSYRTTYEIVVTNVGAGATTYHLDDELRFGAGITVDSATVSNADPGTITTSSTWDGLADLRIATDVPIAGGVAHTYQVVVDSTPAGSVGGGAADCELGGGEDGTGFLNVATATHNGVGLDDDACAPLAMPEVELLKEMVGDPVSDGDGTYTITYDITVTNPADVPSAYDLTDTLRYGAGISVTSSEVQNTDPGSITTNPSWDGLTDVEVVSDQPIGASGSHVYRAVITAVVPGTSDPSDLDCNLTEGEQGSGFLNEAVVTQGSTSLDDDACALSSLVEPPTDPTDPVDPADPDDPWFGDGYERLAYTGASIGVLVLLGIGLIGIGGRLTRSGRRRRHGAHDEAQP